ncbi:sensor histidine kinase [Herbidospora mongoliensis]|uniref:sensor histidine kinase n=1 Tax=Herbidospora mongoliensis TaxID=688067 RepID=UPI00082DA138|nr:sensor histidine kinase [Herbidospora mongoliensis]
MRRWSLARQMFALQIVVVVATVAAGTVMGVLQTRDLVAEDATAVTKAVAVSVASAPSVLAALGGPDPTALLQPYTEKVRLETGVGFITIMSPSGIRYTHPTPAEIGRQYLGTIPAAGQTVSETYTGTLGPSMRTITPVQDASGQVRGLVSAGITVENIGGRLREQLEAGVLAGLLGLAAGTAGTYLAGRRLRRHTHDLGTQELTLMYDYHEAILHAVREGLLLVDGRNVLTLCNDGARELLGLPPDAEGRPVVDLGLPPSLTELLSSGGDRTDEIHLTGDRVLLVSVAAVRSGTRSLGTVVTLRDHTELQDVTGQLDAERGFADALRSAAHESANRLHTVITLVELGRPEEAVTFATEELQAAQELTDRVVAAVREPVLAALLLGKSAQAAERGVELSISPESELDDVGLDPHDLVAILGNLIDNAVDAAMAGAPPARVEVHVGASDSSCEIRVADSGPGLDPARVEEAYQRGWTTKGTGRGLGLPLAVQAVRRLGGTIEVSADQGAVFTVRLPLPERTAS